MLTLSKLGFLFRLLLIRVSYYSGDLKRDPNMENYPRGGSLRWIGKAAAAFVQCRVARSVLPSVSQRLLLLESS